MAVGPGGVVEVWPSLPKSETVTAYALCTGYLEQLRLYGENGRLLKVRAAKPTRRLGAVRRLLARTIYNPQVEVSLEYDQLVPYEFSELKERLLAAVASDDDIITQFHDAATIKSWVERAVTFSDVVVALRRAQQEGGDA